MEGMQRYLLTVETSNGTVLHKVPLQWTPTSLQFDSFRNTLLAVALSPVQKKIVWKLFSLDTGPFQWIPADNYRLFNWCNGCFVNLLHILERSDCKFCSWYHRGAVFALIFRHRLESQSSLCKFAQFDTVCGQASLSLSYFSRIQFTSNLLQLNIKLQWAATEFHVGVTVSV